MMTDQDLARHYPELLAVSRRRHPVEVASETGGRNEVVKESFTLDDATLIREVLLGERDFGMALMQCNVETEPGNELARQAGQRLERNIGRLNDLILAKF